MGRKKLTLSVDEAAIRKARRYSSQRGTSISELVTRFLSSLDEDKAVETPLVSRLRGLLPPDATIEDYRRYLAKKHAK